MVHQRQGLPLGLEAGDDLAGVHARLDDLEGDLAAHRLLLLGHEDDAEAAFADLLQQLVRADDRAGPFADGVVDGGAARIPVEEIARSFVGLEQPFDVTAQFAFAGARFCKIGHSV